MRFRSPGSQVLLLAVLVAVAAACAGSSEATATAANRQVDSGPTTVRLAYFPNLTHASAIVGVEKGIFADKLGSDKLDPKLFNAGPDVVTALFSDAVDAAYIGPNPAINAFSKSHGKAIRIVSGATSGGAQLVVKPQIKTSADLAGKRLATPQLGGTQDIAARSWLRSQGLKTDAQGGGDVTVLPIENAQILERFKSSQIEAAWVPEPWATRLVLEGGGKVLVDEKALWPGGGFVTTQLVVATAFLAAHPDVVRRLIEGQVAANDYLASHSEDAKSVVSAAIARYTGKPIGALVIDGAWKNLTFTNDPIASSLAVSAKAAADLGLLKPSSLDGIYDLKLLNDVLKHGGLAEVTQ